MQPPSARGRFASQHLRVVAELAVSGKQTMHPHSQEAFLRLLTLVASVRRWCQDRPIAKADQGSGTNTHTPLRPRLSSKKPAFCRDRALAMRPSGPALRECPCG